MFSGKSGLQCDSIASIVPSMAQSTHCSLKEKMDRFPPVVCYLIARDGGPTSRCGGPVRHVGMEAIADIAMMPIGEVARLSWQPSWDPETVGTMLRFTRACGVDFDDRQNFSNNWKFLRRQVVNGMPYLRRDKAFDRDFKPRIEAYVRMLSGSKERK